MPLDIYSPTSLLVPVIGATSPSFIVPPAAAEVAAPDEADVAALVVAAVEGVDVVDAQPAAGRIDTVKTSKNVINVKVFLMFSFLPSQ